MNKVRFNTFTFLITMLLPALVWGENDSVKKVYSLDVRDEISRGMARQVSKALNEAVQMKADVFLINMNTYGGMLDAADSIRTSMLASKIPSIVFINNNAASAGALIAISCNKIYMRSIMRSTAETRGRDPKIAEAMVDPRTYIKGVNDSGKVLTMTSTEALQNKYCDGIAESVDEVLKAEGISTYVITEYKATFVDRLINFLINPAISGVLILIMLGGIYYEMQSPGIGIPLIAAVQLQFCISHHFIWKALQKTGKCWWLLQDSYLLCWKYLLYRDLALPEYQESS